jgi:hypothetical protein
MSAILIRHFELLNAILMKTSIFFWNQHTLIMFKNHAGPNNNYLPLKVFFRLNRTRLYELIFSFRGSREKNFEKWSSIDYLIGLASKALVGQE